MTRRPSPHVQETFAHFARRLLPVLFGLALSAGAVLLALSRVPT